MDTKKNRPADILRITMALPLREELTAVARSRGYTTIYYVLYLIGRDLGYLRKKATLEETQAWLKTKNPVKVISRHHVSQATAALLNLPKGAHTVSEIAKAAGLSYQQAYRQLKRDPRAKRVEGQRNGYIVYFTT